jgi:hypothetical protein
VSSGLLICGDDDWRELYGKRIEYTYFPEPGVRFRYANWLICVPSQY